MTPCQENPELFELPAQQAAVDGERVEWAQSLCVRACKRLAECRKEGPGITREAVWAGLIITRTGEALESMDEFRAERVPDKRGRRTEHRPRTVLPLCADCAHCGAPNSPGRKRYCSDLCAGRAQEARRVRVVVVDKTPLPPCPTCGAEVIRPQKLHCSLKCKRAAHHARKRAARAAASVNARIVPSGLAAAFRQSA